LDRPIIARPRLFASLQPFNDFALVKSKEPVDLERRDQALLSPRIHCGSFNVEELRHVFTRKYLHSLLSPTYK
jgi:hypothetical protein